LDRDDMVAGRAMKCVYLAVSFLRVAFIESMSACICAMRRNWISSCLTFSRISVVA